MFRKLFTHNKFAEKFKNPFIQQNKVCPFIILKMDGSITQFQRKNWVGKICIRSQDIGINMLKLDLPNHTFKFWHIFTNISGSDAYFSKPIFALFIQVCLLSKCLSKNIDQCGPWRVLFYHESPKISLAGSILVSMKVQKCLLRTSVHDKDHQV